MKKSVLLLVTLCLNMLFFACTKPVAADEAYTIEACCGDGDDIPPPPPGDDD